MTLLRFRKILRALSPALVLLVVVACERTAPNSQVDSGGARRDTASVTPPAERKVSGWSAAAGSVFLVQGETPNEAILLLPEGEEGAEAVLGALATRAGEVSLLGRAGVRLTAQLGNRPTEMDPECRIWPLQSVRGQEDENSWAVGFVGGQVSALALDSMDLLSSRDSMALAAEASRLASTVTGLTPPSFQGLRFTAHDIRRFEVAPGVQALVAHLSRKVNQEANPQQEQTLVIAERDSGSTSGPYQLAYAERTHGLEEQVATHEVIAGASIAGRPTLVVARDSDDGVAYVMVERTGRRQWRIRWTSSATRCR